MSRLSQSVLGVVAAAALALAISSPAVAQQCANADTPVDQLGQTDAEAAVLCLTNSQRAQNGLQALAPNAALATAARGHATAAVAQKWWVSGADWHTNPQTGSTPTNRIFAAGYCPNPRSWSTGENTYWAWAWGTNAAAPTPAQAVTSWMNSPGHRANILSTTFTELGVGVVAGTAASVDQADVKAGTFVQTFGNCVN